MYRDATIPKKKVVYTSSIKRIFTIDCIEDFWKYIYIAYNIISVYNCLPTLFDLLPNTDYMMFKADVRPEWEAPANKEGGKWVLTIDSKDQEAMDIQKIWEMLLLSLIGCTIKNYEYINGIVVSIRDRHARFSLWTRAAESKETLREIGQHIREVANLSPKFQVVYQLHASALNMKLDNNFISAL